jgi:hypothetical protein
VICRRVKVVLWRCTGSRLQGGISNIEEEPQPKPKAKATAACSKEGTSRAAKSAAGAALTAIFAIQEAHRLS